MSALAGAPFWAAASGGTLAVFALLAANLPPRRVIDIEPEPEADEAVDVGALVEAACASVPAALDLPLFLLGRDGSVIFQNRAAERLFGPVPHGAHITARLRSPGILDMVRETMTTGEPNQIEHSERLPSDAVYVVRIAPLARVLPEADGAHYVLSLRDISELRRIDRMRSDFVANASHELRTPLASMRGFIETLQGPAKDDTRARERFLSIMLDQATRMSRLVDDLLSLSRLEVKSHIAPDSIVDLVPLIGKVRDSLAPLAEELGVEIVMDAPQGKVEVAGDPDELVQVFENLMENACKYGQEGKKVEVRIANEPGRPVEVAIRDYGPGIPAEHVPRLTERFYRVNVEASRSRKGTGLGLAIVKHILTRHRARLVVRSQEGQGSEFTVRF
ncbi:phosphate regulon sensor histidine kinase PhoR [Rhizobiaceae bacterium BDR2-2]|uniref:histidine kinase n=1 Tax=Ectorhizobium quercum TaxID=2965071 RepID=A0AAE3SUC3_9HYPH|nr:phosphate regulon sensor histidine kinase PhoR [Ectorhizobium quercum]MCX8995874.1 phosphate regulon sensor histidine kinase PhoR [Ectorhizobium quercum]